MVKRVLCQPHSIVPYWGFHRVDMGRITLRRRAEAMVKGNGLLCSHHRCAKDSALRRNGRAVTDFIFRIVRCVMMVRCEMVMRRPVGIVVGVAGIDGVHVFPLRAPLELVVHTPNESPGHPGNAVRRCSDRGRLHECRAHDALVVVHRGKTLENPGQIRPVQERGREAGRGVLRGVRILGILDLVQKFVARVQRHVSMKHIFFRKFSICTRKKMGYPHHLKCPWSISA